MKSATGEILVDIWQEASISKASGKEPMDDPREMTFRKDRGSAGGL